MKEIRSGLREVGRRAAADLNLVDDDLASVALYTDLPRWQSSLRVGELAMDAVALASLTMNAVAADRGTRRRDAPVRIRPERVAASFGSERLFRIDGEPPSIWSPLSGFWRCADGWVRTHGNYPHHADRLRVLLGLPDSPDRADVATAIERWTGVELEEEAHSFGALVTAVRSAERWREHPHARALSQTPLLSRWHRDNAAPRQWPNATGRPLAGIRVLDLTRVIAGPVATRDLAHAGADVLRIDSPALPEAAWQYLDTGQGKRSTLLDLRRHTDREDFENLLASADVVVLGYRPGALTRFGLDLDTLAEERPGLVIAELSAWGTAGRWSRRRGFDSLVQAATGISLAESSDDGTTPGALPVQALDHSAGHFLAAAVSTALRQQRAVGGTIAVSTNLARIAQELLAAGAAPPSHPIDDAVDLPTATHEVRLSLDQSPAIITSAVPSLDFADAPEQYRNTGSGWGVDSPEWTTTRFPSTS